MSDLLKTKTAEAQSQLAQALEQEKGALLGRLVELETLQNQLAQLNAGVANLTQSSPEKPSAEAQVVEITSAKKGKKATKAPKAAAAPVVAAAAPVAAAAAPAKGAKGKKGKSAKAAEKTAAPAKPAASPKKTKTAAQVTRVAGEDKKPPLRERLRIVLGEDQVTIPLAIERLRAKDASWLPESTDLNAYISLALSTHKETFERVSRGVYQVVKGAVAAAPKTVKKAVTAAKTNGTHNPSNGIEDLGTNIKDNPFTATTVAA